MATMSIVPGEIRRRTRNSFGLELLNVLFTGRVKAKRR